MPSEGPQARGVPVSSPDNPAATTPLGAERFEVGGTDGGSRRCSGALPGTPAGATGRAGRRAVAVVLTVLVAAGVARAYAAAARPIQPGLTLGLHAIEPNGRRWTRGGVVMNLPVEGRRLLLDIAFPIPQVVTRPQEVAVWLDGKPVRRVTLADGAWRTIEVPVDRPLGRFVLLQLRVGYTFVPGQLGFGADPRRLGVLIRPVRWAS